MLRKAVIFFVVVAVVGFSVTLLNKPQEKKSADHTAPEISRTANGIGMPDIRFGGTWSTFGGPEDMNAIREVQGDVGGTGLAAIDNESYLPAGMILPETDPRVIKAKAEAKSRGYTQGIKLIGRLNPGSYYIAMRWPIPYLDIRNGQATGLVTNNRTGASVEAAIVDWGPNVTTGKDADLSPGIVSSLGLSANDTVSFAYVSKAPAKQESLLPKFNSVSWNLPSNQTGDKEDIFELFSRFTNDLAKPIPIPKITSAGAVRNVAPLPENILAIKPLGSLAKFMSSYTETEVRTTLGNAGITFNADAPKTIMAGLGQRAMDGLLYFQSEVGGFMINGGTETTGGHTTHGLEDDYTENNVDLNPNPKLDSFIKSAKETRTGTDGTIYILYDNRGQKIECMDEGNHWHCMFKPEARKNPSSVETPGDGDSYDSGDSGGGTSGGSSGSSGSTAFCGNGVWSSNPLCCYKNTGPAGGPNQYDGVRTCNAGFAMKSGKPTPVPDCGPMGKLCDIKLSIAQGGKFLSCLVTACAPGRNAIWDPMTKRCGCDDGMGGALFASDSSGSSGGGDSTNPSVPSAPASGQGEAIPDNVKITHSNDEAGFQTGTIIDKNGNAVSVNPRLYQAVNGISSIEGNDDITITSIVGQHQAVTVSNLNSQHPTGDAMDVVANNEASIAYIYEHRVELGVYQIISNDYPQYNYRDGQDFQYSPEVLAQETGIFHVGFLRQQ